MSEKQGKNSKSLFQKLKDMLNPQPGLTKEEKKQARKAARAARKQKKKASEAEAAEELIATR